MPLSLAIDFARAHHEGQTRKNGEPFVEHCLRVMERTKEASLEGTFQVVAVLHDVLEMTSATEENLTFLFGTRVSKLVAALSKLPRDRFQLVSDVPWDHQLLPQHKRTLNYIARLKRAAYKDPDVLFIKIFDQLDNLESLQLFSPPNYYRILYTIAHYFLPLYKDCFSKFEGQKRLLFQHCTMELEQKVVEGLEKL